MIKIINYRPVSLTSINYKLLESIIRDQVQMFLDEKVIYSSQHGFTKCKSYLTNLIELFIGFLNSMIKGTHLILYM